MQPSSFHAPARDTASLERRTAAPEPPGPPRWIADAMPRPRLRAVHAGLTVTTSGPLALLSRTVPGAGRLDANAFRGEVARAYDVMGRALRALRRHPIRWWNYLPNPAAAMGPGLDRYMVFNAGRLEGYMGLLDDGPPQRSFATASAVGIEGETLVIHCLASREGGRAVENPRQKPAWRYSSKYGPVPPSFSRATIVTTGTRPLLLIGGTASVVGEDSMHEGDVQAQFEETLRNLAALVAAACGQRDTAADPLERIRSLRAYVTRAEDVPFVQSALRTRMPGALDIELLTARLCRPELLVEIEGVADLGSPAFQGVKTRST